MGLDLPAGLSGELLAPVVQARNSSLTGQCKNVSCCGRWEMVRKWSLHRFYESFSFRRGW